MPKNAFGLLALTAAMLGYTEAAYAAKPNIREGLWDVTARVADAKGEASVPPTTAQHCISHKDFQDPQKFIPGGKGGGCEITDHRTSGNTVTWKMSCSGKTPMTGSGSLVFAEASYTGSSQISVKRGDETVQMTVRYDGKYVGPCKK